MVMKRIFLFIIAALVVFVFFAWNDVAFGYENKALILVDAQTPSGVDLGSDEILANLLGHFDLPYEIKTIDTYTKGDVDQYRVTFYIGNAWDNQPPLDFLNDVMETNSRVVWINYNLWKVAWNDYQPAFESRFGFRFVQTTATGNYDKVTFGGKTLTRSQGDFEKVTILNGSLAQATSFITNGSRNFP